MPHQDKNEHYYYPNRMGRIVLQSMETVLGRERLEEVVAAAGLEHLINPLPTGTLDKKFDFEWVSGLQEAVEKVYGEKVGRSLNLRVGRGTFEKGLKDFDPVLGIADLPLRLMPLGMKFRVGLDVFARVFNQFTDQIVRLSEDEKHYIWIIERCPVCWSRHTNEPCCQLSTGLLEESTFWGTGGRRFKVEEVKCIAAGDEACVFEIDRQPIE